MSQPVDLQGSALMELAFQYGGLLAAIVAFAALLLVFMSEIINEWRGDQIGRSTRIKQAVRSHSLDALEVAVWA
jgi:hypothetical protein